MEMFWPQDMGASEVLIFLPLIIATLATQVPLKHLLLQFKNYPSHIFYFSVGG